MERFLPQEEYALRISRAQEALAAAGFDGLLASANATVYYLTGHVLCGFIYVPAEGTPIWFVRRPKGLQRDDVVYIKKPEQIPGLLAERGLKMPSRLGLELGRMSYDEALRLFKAFPGAETEDCSGLLSGLRAVKTEWELGRIRTSGIHHAAAYSRIHSVFRTGMTDYELQVEMERILRLEGCLGQFRIAGESMELFMGNVLAGENADAASPYDFALGGAGMDSSLPVGCDGTVIRPGTTVMLDMNGNFTGYMTDMTRSYRMGKVPAEVEKAHQLSIDIHAALRNFIRPGVAAKDAYNLAAKMVDEAGLLANFMGHSQQAGFIGHGLGIEINEWPVLAPRSRQVFEKGNVIAIEPKFVFPGVGAVGIENTYAVGDDALECLTNLPEELDDL